MALFSFKPALRGKPHLALIPRSNALAAQAEEAKKLGAFAYAALHRAPIAEHFAEHAGDRARAEVVGFVKAFHRAENFVARKSVVFQRGGLLAVRIHEIEVFAEPAIFLRLAVELRPRIRRGEAHLYRKHIERFRILDG